MRASEGQAGLQLPRQQVIVARRYLPVLGHTDGALSVLEWHTWKTVFCTQAHSPGPVIAISSTWNVMVSSGQYVPPSPHGLWGEPLPPAPKAQPWLPPGRQRPDREDVARLPVC